MLNIFGIILFIFAYLLAFAVFALHSLHIFQQNSYKPNVQLVWINRNFKLYLKNLIFLVPITLIIILLPRVGYCICAALLAAAALTNIPGKAVKPLVYTNRVKRMLVTIGIFAVIPIVFFLMKFNVLAAFLSSTAVFSAPWLVLLANSINAPIEKHINDGFINEARSMIRSCPDLKVIGVTGSYGKTSVKFFLGKILAAKYDVLITPESYNTTLGVVRTIRENLSAKHEIFVCEMGARNPGDIAEICDIVKPDIGIITAIGPQHLESFKTIDNILKTKFELADSLPEGAPLFLNTDNEYLNRFSDKCISYGTNDRILPYHAYNIKISSRGSSFSLIGKNGKEYSFTTKLIGTHNIINLAGAIAIADQLDVPMSDIALRVRRLESVPHRLQLITTGNGIIIDDAYNSNPEGCKAALETLSRFDGTKILVTPGMVELGEKEYDCNFTFGSQAAAICDYVVLVGEKRAQPIFEGLCSSGFLRENIYIASDFSSAMYHINQLSFPSKVILIENDLPDNYNS